MAQKLCSDAPTFQVGDWVTVDARTWANINQPGGVARITGLIRGGCGAVPVASAANAVPPDNIGGPLPYPNSSEVAFVSVRYVLDGRQERKVAIQYVHEYEQVETRLFRDRSTLLGRCTRCGSLRSDCGSCDQTLLWSTTDIPNQRSQRSTTSATLGLNVCPPATSTLHSQGIGTASSESESSSAEESLLDLDKLLERQKYIDRMYRRLQARSRRLTSAQLSQNPSSHPLLRIDSTRNASIAQQTGNNLPARQRKRSRATFLRRASVHKGNNGSSVDQNSLLHMFTCNAASSNTSNPVASSGRLRVSYNHKNKENHRTDDLSLSSSPALTQSPSHQYTLSSRPAEDKLKSDASDSSSSKVGPLFVPGVDVDASLTPESESESVRVHHPLVLAHRRHHPETDRRANGENEDEQADEEERYFLQPENLAHELLKNADGWTNSIPFQDLPRFVNRKIHSIQEQLRVAAKKVNELERQGQHLYNEMHHTVNHTPDRAIASKSKWKDVCHSYHIQLVEDLVRNGTDQCHLALRQLAKQRRLDRNELAWEALSLQLDPVSEQVEDLIRRMLALVRYVDSEDELGEDDSSNRDDNDFDDDGWVEPAECYSQIVMDALPNPIDDEYRNPQDVQSSSFDPHMYASRKRKQVRTRDRFHRTKSKPLQNSLGKPMGSEFPFLSGGRSDDEVGESDEASLMIAENNNRRKPSLASGARKKRNQSIQSSYHLNPFQNNHAEQISNESSSSGGESYIDGGIVNTPVEGPSSSCRTGERARRNYDHFDSHPSRTLHQTSAEESPKISVRQPNGNQRGLAMAMPDERHEFSVTDDYSVGNESFLSETRHEYMTNRMKRFLDANRDTSNESQLPGERVRRKRAKLMRTKNPRDCPTRNSSGAIDLTNFLYSKLDSVCNEEFQSNHLSAETDIVNLLKIFSESYPTLSSIIVMRKIVTVALALVDDTQAPSRVLSVLFDMLRKYGNDTLTCLVSRKESIIRSHLSLLATLLKLMQAKIHHYLTVADGLLYDVLSQDKCGQFVLMVQLQSLDLAYALVHPKAWALDICDSDRTLLLEDLMSFRRVLFDEEVSPGDLGKCLWNDFAPQVWRTSRDGCHFYVSSVDPEAWSNLLSSGIPSTISTVSRLQCFGNTLPQVEIDALWRILAVFSSQKVSAGTDQLSHSFYWKLIEKIFICGVIRQEKDDAISLPPSSLQLDAANKHIRLMTKLLNAGCTARIPEKDSFMTKLVQRALELQVAALKGSHTLEDSLRPRLSNEKADAKSLNIFWKWTLSLRGTRVSGNNAVPASDFVNRLLIDVEPISSFGHIRFTPSGILQSCCGLLSAWTRRVPLKKARRSRLTFAIKNLVKEAGSCSYDKAPGRGDTFTSAFGSEDATDADNPTIAGRAFASETSALFLLFSRIVESTFNPSLFSFRQLCEEIWSLVGIGDLRIQQQCIFDSGKILSQNLGESTETLTLTKVQIYVAAKVMVMLAAIVLGLDLFESESYGYKTFTVFLPLDNIQREDLVFLITCLLSCLYCTCIVDHSREVSINVSCMLGLIVARAQQLQSTAINTNIDERLDVSITFLKDKIGLLVLPIFLACIGNILKATQCVVLEGMAFESILSLLRVCLSSIQSNTPLITRTPQDALLGANQDLWNEIHDNPFVDIDFDVETVMPKTLATCVFEYLWSLVDESKPSKRFTISTSNGLSAQAKCLVARHKSSVCRCIVSSAAAGGEDLCRGLLSRLSGSYKFFTEFETFGDSYARTNADYTKKASRIILTELVSLAQSLASVQHVLSKSTDHYLSLVLAHFVDCRLLEKLPSCNLDRIRSKSGITGEKIEFTYHLEVANGSKTSVKKATRTQWATLASLGQSLLLGDSRIQSIGRCLIQLNDNPRDFLHNLSPYSVEFECFLRFRLFHGVLSSDSQESLNILVMMVCMGSTVLANLDKDVGSAYCEINAETTSSDHANVKKFEVFDCYLCFHVSVLALTFRMASQSRAQELRQLVQNVGDVYLSRWIHRKPLITGVAFVDGQFSLQSPIGISASPLAGEYIRALEKRYSEFIIFAAYEFELSGERHHGLLFESLLSAAVDGDDRSAWLFCCSLSIAKNHTAPFSVDPVGDQLIVSPLQTTIESYLNRFGDFGTPRVLSVEDSLVMLKLRRYTLKEKLSLRLCMNQKGSVKHGVLRLLRYLLEIEKKDFVSFGSQRTMELETLCSLAHGMRLTMQNTLTTSPINEDIVTSIYELTLGITNLPAALVDERASGWFIDWCLAPSDPLIDSFEPECVEYLNGFFHWICDLGKVLNDTIQPTALRLYLAELRQLKTKNWNEPAANDASRSGVLSTWFRLIHLDRKMYTTPIESSVRPVVNVYAPKRISDSSLREEWVPSLRLRGRVAVFVEKVKGSLSL